MNETVVRDTVNQYKTIYGELRRKNRWFAGDQRILMMAASFYVMNSTPFDVDAYSTLADYIKKESTAFSPFRSHQRYVTAAMLDQRFGNPKEKFVELTQLYDDLVTGGFRRGPFTVIAAIVLLTGDRDDSTHSDAIKKSLDVYNSMTKHHPFITSKNDYPLSVMLARLDEEDDVLMERVENYYRSLSQNGFRKGNDLQFLSHILSLDSNAQVNDHVSKTLHMWDELKKRDVKMKAMHYPAAGLLTLTDASSSELDLVKDMTDELNRTKWFKWQKDMNTIMAINFVIKGKIDDHKLAETGLYTTMETVIQAQQAAMIAAVGASAAAANNNNN